MSCQGLSSILGGTFNPEYRNQLVVAFWLSSLIVAFSVVTSCGGFPEDPRCFAEPPDWYHGPGGIPDKAALSYFDSERGECHSPAYSFECGPTCWEYSEERCNECRTELYAWFPFMTIEECQDVCE